MPVYNPLRDVGRNDPCPCGSGRKFKKCCLGKPVEQLQAVAAPGDFFSADELDDLDDDDGPVRDYDPLVEPNPDDWLATGEQRRIDVIKHYHRREGFNADRIDLHATVHAIVENQIAEGDRLPVRRTMSRLMAEGLDRHAALHAVASVLAGHINELLRETDAKASDEDVNSTYFSALERLTAKAWLRSG